MFGKLCVESLAQYLCVFVRVLEMLPPSGTAHSKKGLGKALQSKLLHFFKHEIQEEIGNYTALTKHRTRTRFRPKKEPAMRLC